MPRANHFRHQPYTPERPTTPWRLLRPERPSAPGSEAFQDQLAAAAKLYAAAHVSRIYLIHGTYFGSDALGLWSELARVMPAAADVLRSLSKSAVDSVVGTHGNYTDQYAADLAAGLSTPEHAVRVQRFNWSSANHHLARADAAVRLIDELIPLTLERRTRVQLWGHSHGGNVLAIVSNLLAGHVEALMDFFRAARGFYHRPVFKIVDQPHWQRVQQTLEDDRHALRKLKLDIVTFGTPARYGWDSDGYSHLLHFIHHRPTPNRPEWLADDVADLSEIRTAADGDYVQRFGIAGSDVPPPWLAWRAYSANRKLGSLLERGLSVESLRSRLKVGVRVPNEGETLLVDYGPGDPNPAVHMAGHAIYTEPEWMAFHAMEAAERFYGKEVG